MPRHFKVHELLSEPQLQELRAFAREPGRTVDEVHEWLEAQGCVIGRTAAWNWKAAFDQELLEERFRRSGEFASSLVAAAKDSGAVAVADAAILQLSQVVFEQSVKMQADGEVDPGDVLKWAISLRQLVGSKQQVERMLAEKFDKEMEREVRAAQQKKGGAIGPEEIASARKRIFGN